MRRFALIRDGMDNIVQRYVSSHPGGLPTSEWAPGFYIEEHLTLNLPPGTPPGDYHLQVGMQTVDGSRRLNITGQNGTSPGVYADLATLKVRRPRSRARTANLPAAPLLSAQITESLVLVAATTPPSSAAVGEPLPMVWYWRAAQRPAAQFNTQLIWINDQDQVAAGSEIVPPIASLPTDAWKRRDLWRGLHVLYVPGVLEAGDYEVAVQLLDAEGTPTGTQVTLGLMTVTAPVRSFEPPEMMIETSATWSNGIRLLGYNLPKTTIPQGDGLRATLYWQTEQPLTESLTVMLQLVSENRNLMLHREQIPAAGARSTTSWTPGEIITDQYGFLLRAEDVPPGEYQVQVGLYDARSGEVITRPGNPWLTLPQPITVEADQ